MPSGRTGSRTSILHEFELIRSLHRLFGATRAPVIRGIGEDAAVVRISAAEAWLITTDLLAEGVHFNRSTATFNDIGYRAAIANLSDIAAMGGAPRFLLASVAIPSHLRTGDIISLYRGMMRACRPHRVQLIGGDTSASKQGLFLNLMVIGSARLEQILRRDGAKIGDLLYVTGTLGDSRVGLELLQRSASIRPRRLRQDRTARTGNLFLIRRYVAPTARVNEGLFLARHRLASAAIDISDGLSGDLRHLCEQSGVGAEVELAALPLSPACRAFAGRHRVDPTQLALSGGEDYELLVTVPPRKRARLERLAHLRGFHMTCIGRITAARTGIQTRGPEGTRRPLPVTSYEHFHRAT